MRWVCGKTRDGVLVCPFNAQPSAFMAVCRTPFYFRSFNCYSQMGEPPIFSMAGLRYRERE
jgi:hypothetical protein